MVKDGAGGRKRSTLVHRVSVGGGPFEKVRNRVKKEGKSWDLLWGRGPLRWRRGRDLSKSEDRYSESPRRTGSEYPGTPHRGHGRRRGV